jgi:hypothetical protein
VNQEESQRRRTDGCSAPTIGLYATPYCFGDATDEEREAFAAHLIDCDACWEVVQRLETAMRVLRENASVMQPLIASDVVSVLGVSGKLNVPFGGHSQHAIAASASCAGLFALALIVETAFEFDRFGAKALSLVPALFAIGMATSLAALAIDWWRTKNDRADGVLFALVVLVLGCAGAFALARTILPNSPIVQATFLTYTAQSGFLKSLLQLAPLMLLLVFLPFHAVVALQRELSQGRVRLTLELLAGERGAIAPKGCIFPSIRTVGIIVAMAAVGSLYALSHLLENLLPSPQVNFFTLADELRWALYFGLAIEGLIWYSWALNELRREARMLDEYRGRQ